MDLGAYVQISDLQAVADANGISIHRLRGYRLMVEQEPYSEEDLQEGIEYARIVGRTCFWRCAKRLDRN